MNIYIVQDSCITLLLQDYYEYTPSYVDKLLLSKDQHLTDFFAISDTFYPLHSLQTLLKLASGFNFKSLIIACEVYLKDPAEHFPLYTPVYLPYQMYMVPHYSKWL